MLRWRLLLSLGILSVVAPGASLAAQAPPVQLVVANLQLPSEPAQWLAQRDAIVAKLQNLNPDVIAVQRILKTNDAPSQACWLAKQLNYSCTIVTSTPPSHPQRHGSALLARHPLLEDGLTLLHPGSRYSSAGLIRIQLADVPINVYVANLGDTSLTPDALHHQSDDLRAWIAATGDGVPTVIAGEFAVPAADLAQRLSGFQAIRRNPRGVTISNDDHQNSSGWDVLYRVRQFADVSQKLMYLPAQTGEARAAPFGMLATLRLLKPLPLAAVQDDGP